MSENYISSYAIDEKFKSTPKNGLIQDICSFSNTLYILIREVGNIYRLKAFFSNGDFDKCLYESKSKEILSSIAVCQSGIRSLMISDLTNNRIMKTNDFEKGKNWYEFIINIKNPKCMNDMKHYRGYLIIGNDDGIHLYDIKGELIWTNESFIASKVACLFNGSIAFIDSKDKNIKLLSGEDGQFLKCFPSLKGYNSIICFFHNRFVLTSPENNLIVVYDHDGKHCGTLQVWIKGTMESIHSKYPIMATYTNEKLYLTCQENDPTVERIFLFQSIQY